MLMDFTFLCYLMLGIYLVMGLLCLVTGSFLLRTLFPGLKPYVASMREKRIPRDPGNRAPMSYESGWS